MKTDSTQNKNIEIAILYIYDFKSKIIYLLTFIII